MTRLTRKERVRRALFAEPVDRLPTQINTTPAMAVRLAECLGCSVAALSDRLDNHLLRLEPPFPRQ